MITIAILGTLTVLAAKSIQQAIKAKGKLQTQIDDVSRMRDAVRLLERDINLAYHYRDIEKELQTLIKKKQKGAASNNSGAEGNMNPNASPTGDEFSNNFGAEDPYNQDPLNNPDAQEKREVPRIDPETHLIGTNETLNFVTLNNARTVRNAKQADYVEVGYSLKDCKSLTEDKESSKCLWRRSSPFVDIDVTKGGDEVVLLENVSEFKLRFIGKGKQDWVGDWRTDQGGDGATKGKFPLAVEISITISKSQNNKNKKYSMQMVVPIHFPNNSEETANAPGFPKPTSQ
jgi:hypothetical protein